MASPIGKRNVSRRCRQTANFSRAKNSRSRHRQGVHVTVTDGTWGLLRASSNKPELVVVIEGPVSEAGMREMFAAVDAILRGNPEVGAHESGA
jgi:phosphomannomutase